MKFKVGDRVITINPCSECAAGGIYTLAKYGNELYAQVIEGQGCSCQSNWKIVKEDKKATKIEEESKLFLKYLYKKGR